MNEVLSQFEIDNLLNELAAGGGQKPEDGSCGPDENVKPYDFRTANRFPKEQMRTIHIVMQNYAQLLTNFFTGALRSSCELELASIKECSFHEYNNALPGSTVLAIVGVEPFEGSILLQLSAEISDAVISRLFGGASTNTLTNKAFTEIELAIIERVVLQMLYFFDEAWAKVIKTRSHLERIETSNQFTQIVDMNEPVAVITFQANVGPDAGIISICLPHMAVEPVAKQINTRSWYARQGKKIIANSDVMEKRIINTEVELHAIFNDTSASVKDIAYLQVGDVIQLRHRLDEPLTVRVQNIPKFHASIGTKSLKYAVKITDIIQGEEDK